MGSCSSNANQPKQETESKPTSEKTDQQKIDEFKRKKKQEANKPKHSMSIRKTSKLKGYNPYGI